MSRKLWLAVLAITLLVAGVVLYSRLPALLEQRIRAGLADYGVETLTIGGPYWGLSGAGTEGLEIAGRYGQWRYALTITELQAEFHWRMLLDGEIHRLTMTSVTADIHLADDTPDPGEPLAIAALLRDIAALELPLQQIDTEALSLSLATPALKVRARGTDLRGDSASKALSGALSLEFEPLETGQLPAVHLTLKDGSLDWLPDLEIALGQRHRPAVTASASLHAADGDTRGAADLRFSAALAGNLEQLRPFLPAPHSDLGQLLGNTSGSLSLAGSLALPEVLDTRQPDWLQTLPLALEAVVGLTVAGPGLPTMADLGVADLSIDGRLALANPAHRLEVTLVEPLRIGGNLSAETLGIADITGLTGNQPLVLEVSAGEPLSLALAGPESGIPMAGPLDFALSLGAGRELTASGDVDGLRRDGENLDFDYRAQLTLPYDSIPLPPISLTGRGIQTPQQWSLSAATLEIPRWEIIGSGVLTATAQGPLRGSAELRIADLPLVLAGLKPFAPIPPELSLASGRGTANISFEAKPDRPATQRVELALANLAGLYDGLAFSGATVAGRLSLGQQWRTATPITLTVDQLSTGVLLTQVKAVLALKPSATPKAGNWRLESAEANLFSGTLALAEPADINFPFTGNRLTFTLSNLRLDDILGLYRDQGISGRGVLNGRLPLVLEAEGVRVDNGSLLAASPGGQLALDQATSRAWGAGNEQLAMTLKLLENFHYQVLEVATDFHPDGQLILTVRLEGRNPNEFDGRQVNFNITFEENLYQLFRVLKLSDELTKRLEERIQQQRSRP